MGLKNPRAAAENQGDPKSRTEGTNNLVAPLVACSTLGSGDIQLVSGTHCFQEGQQRKKKKTTVFKYTSVRLDKEYFGSTDPQTDALCIEHISGKKNVT